MWGLHSHIIELVLKCRVTEDLIDCAQRCLIRPDGEMHQELALMTRLRDQTWADIREYIQRRGPDKWRTWDNPRDLHFKKPVLHDDGDPLLKLYSIDPDVDLNDYMATEGKKLPMMMAATRALERDFVTHVTLSKEMVHFLTYVFGSNTWLVLSKLRRHREENR